MKFEQTVVFQYLEQGDSAEIQIDVPAAGNCGDDTLLQCHFTGQLRESVGWTRNGTKVMHNGAVVRPEDAGKYTEKQDQIDQGFVTLVIHNTARSDEVKHGCQIGFNQTGSPVDRDKYLRFECKASAAVVTVTGGKKVVLTVDKLYPASPTLTASFNKENSAVTVPGSRTCSGSTQYSGYYKCLWTASNSLADGSYTYSLLVTTITQADPLTGSFKIVSPQTPNISNVKLEDNREVVYGNESQPVTIQCSSSGGYPAPNVVWYKDSISSSNQLAATSTGTLQGGTYTVTLQHTFTPTASDDMKQFICRSYYPEADSAQRGSKTKSVILYLTLKPSQPAVTQTAVVSTGNTVEVSCRTTGCRPAANISWSYQGSTSRGDVTTTPDAATETYTVVSVFSRQVTAADNGRNVQCVVTHPALVSPSERTASINLNISFSVGPSTTHITGNKEMIATGQTALTLTCTTGSSNPASKITWKNSSATLTSSLPYTSSVGDNDGVVRSQQLVLYPTRYMDSDVITCSVSNIVSQSDVVDTITLNLKYSPLVTIQGQEQNTLTEGESKQLSCKVDSKPSSAIKWYHGSSFILQGTPVSNVLNYSLTPVNRTHYGDYSCKASNGIGSEHQAQISITVIFEPLTTAITGNINIIADGKNTLPLVCTSGSSNPISDITWRINNVITPHTGSISDQSGDFGGMKRRQRLTLTPTRDNDGDNISCEASNSRGTSERSKVTLDLRYRPLIQPMSEVIAVEENTTVLTCTASSKPASTFKWYRVGQTSILSQETGTLDSNKLSYTINNVRRTDAATYRCNANNGIGTADNGNVLLTIYYPPDVTVTTTNTTTKAATALLTCNARGVPSSKYKYGKWKQTWPGYNFSVSEKPGSEKLVLTALTYEHSGVYTCSASNGVKVFGTNKEFMEGSVELLVKSFPIITNVSEKSPAKLKDNATVEVYYYSNAAGSDVKVYKKVNGSRQAEVIYYVSEARVDVDLQVFTHVVKTGGTRAQIMIQILSQDDMGLYDVVVSNEINSTTRSFEIVPKGPPSKPYNVTVDIIQYNSARLSWIRGYHGGFPQTFVIQLSTDLKNWRNITVYDGMNESEEPISEVLPKLHESTAYYVQMYAFNSEGNSLFTETLNFTTPSKKEEVKPGVSGAVIGGAAGGVSALVIIVVVVVIVVLFQRRGGFTKGKAKAHDGKNDRKPVYVDEDDDGMQDNPMYVSAGPRNQEQKAGGSGVGDGAVYSTVDKNRTVVDSRKNDVYAEVDKSKKTKAKTAVTDNEYATPVKPKGKKEKKEKSKTGFMKDKKGKKLMQEGDLYENATTTEMTDKLPKQNKNDETIYENPEPSKPPMKKNVNKEGLIYADLTFNDQPKGQKKLVIHGLDSMTEYVEVDFTKKADPLPDSDDENNPPKK